MGDSDSIPASGRSPGEGNAAPLQYSCLEIPWTEEPGGLQSMGSQTVEQDRRDWAHMHVLILNTYHTSEDTVLFFLAI